MAIGFGLVNSDKRYVAYVIYKWKS
ncbi:hypothetical protein XAP6164_490003 [Xanthomonas phaseoli pv. phaseoli]|nr:hypothetical protein XAP6164_490003 [Xanthomonas phaseoli pv. phaseoli]